MKVSEFIKKFPVTAERRERIESALPERRAQRLSQEFHRCASCDGEIRYTSQTNWIDHTVVETGSCQSCGGTAAPLKFRLN